MFGLLTIAVPTPENVEQPPRSREAVERTCGWRGPACTPQVGPFKEGGVEDVQVSDRAWPKLRCQENNVLDGQQIKSQCYSRVL